MDTCEGCECVCYIFWFDKEGLTTHISLANKQFLSRKEVNFLSLNQLIEAHGCLKRFARRLSFVAFCMV